MNRRRGFSLLELMTVCAIVCVMAGIAGPNISESMSRANAGAVFNDVEAYMMKTRNTARRINMCLKLQVLAGGNTLHVEPYIQPGCTLTSSDCRCRASYLSDAEKGLPPDLDLLSKRPSAKVTLNNTNNNLLSSSVGAAAPDTLLFLADGSLPYPSNLEIVVKAGVVTRKFSFFPASGVTRGGL
jgi:prepilin-type N-terminal cleavage/methylation domain-containing protein